MFNDDRGEVCGCVGNVLLTASDFYCPLCYCLLDALGKNRFFTVSGVKVLCPSLIFQIHWF